MEVSPHKCDKGACRARTHRLEACMPYGGTYWCSCIQYPGSNAAQGVLPTGGAQRSK